MGYVQEVGVNLQSGNNGRLTSREAGFVGGQMVKKMCPKRTAKIKRQSRTVMGYMQTVAYIATVSV